MLTSVPGIGTWPTVTVVLSVVAGVMAIYVLAMTIRQFRLANILEKIGSEAERRLMYFGEMLVVMDKISDLTSLPKLTGDQLDELEKAHIRLGYLDTKLVIIEAEIDRLMALKRKY
jgi:hypothetical protein